MRFHISLRHTPDSVTEILKTLLEIDGHTDAEIVFDPSKPSMIPVRLVDTNKAESILGFRATTGLREGLEKTIRWYRESVQSGSSSDTF